MSALSDWTDFGKMQADYINAMANYGEKQAESLKLAAEAAKTDAEAQVIWEKVAAIDLVLDSLRKFLNRKGKEWRKLDDQNKQITADVKNLELLVSGDPIGSWSNVWVSYKRIKGTAMLDKDSGDKIDALKVSDDSYGRENFTDNFHAKAECIDMPRTIKYVLSMLDWLKAQKYVANNNGQARRDIRRLLAEINGVAAASKKAVQQQMDNIDDKVFFNWVLPTIGGFINSDGGGGAPKPAPSKPPSPTPKKNG